MEEKYKKDQLDGDGNETSSSDETEDEDGFLATEDLDAQISATLNAIHSKDPRVYDKSTTFYGASDDEAETKQKAKKSDAVYLQDYHRERLLRGDIGASDDEEEEKPQTYTQEQEALKKSIMSEIQAAKGDESADDDDDGDGFMKRKEPEKLDSNGVHPARQAGLKMSEVDVVNADKNPETFLSNFMASRAWLPDEGLRWKAFESDDEGDEDKADAFEEAYNLRFEDPHKSNEVLKSYARDIAAARSVRREEKSKRKRQRDVGREEKEDEKTQRHEEKARLRKLKLEEAEVKLAKIKQAAGATGRGLTDKDWISFLNDAWEDDKWEQEMQKRFGDEYYAVREEAPPLEDEEDQPEAEPSSGKKKAPKKPKWDDDIDIKDIIPDFEDEDAKPEITLSDSDLANDDQDDEDEDHDAQPASKKRKASDHKRERLESQKKARRERSKLEALVDSKLELTNHDLLSQPAAAAADAAAPFRYREVSPQAFGMTPRDILLAPSDQALNEFAGLKKLASFRDEDRKRRDRKSLGKKARLREWRRDNFGRQFEATGPTYGFERFAGRADGKLLDAEEPGEKSNIVGDVGDKKKKKRRRKAKGKESTASEAAS